MAEALYRAGIVGLGMIGGADPASAAALGQSVEAMDGTHFGALSKTPRVRVVAGSSHDEGRRQRFEQRSGAKTYADWREMLDREALDIVSVATYAPVHAEAVIGCAERGIKVIYCEKPIATNLADAEKMAAACDQAGSLLVINHNRRFKPNYRKLRDLVGRGDLGALTSISLRWGTGRLGNVGTHFLDATVMLTGRKVTAVSGTLDLTGRPDCRGPAFRDPGGWGLLRLEGGLIATVDAADEGTKSPWLILHGTRGRALTGNDEVVLEWSDDRREQWPAPAPEVKSMDRAVEEIVAWLDHGGAFPYSARDAIHVLEVILAFHASHERQAVWTELPLRGKDRERELRSG